MVVSSKRGALSAAQALTAVYPMPGRE